MKTQEKCTEYIQSQKYQNNVIDVVFIVPSEQVKVSKNDKRKKIYYRCTEKVNSRL